VNYTAAKSYILQALDALPPTLTYHGKHHTLDVFQAAAHICQVEKISIPQTKLLQTAVLLHDSGFLRSYQNHEEFSCQIAREWLPQFNYTGGGIEQICCMIEATKIPQTPKTFLEMIICDADLDYLGRDDFESIAQTLFEEMNLNGQLISEEDWQLLQVKFLQSHTYFTTTNQVRRNAQKELHLSQLLSKSI
jgi:uncharacterized protein